MRLQPAFLMFLRRYWYPLAAGALIALGVASRLALILLGWPHGNSEEGTMGLEAMHILLRGEHPIYLYGQNYMGVGEAYAGALAFRLFGISTAALRLIMVVCYALFLLGVCWLARLLYSRRVALVSLVALILGTPFLVQIELLADGGKAETMALGALMFALTSWLALTQPAERVSPRRRALRYGAFIAWGVMAGFGLYTYTIIAPFALTTGLLLWLTCRRELRGWALALPLAGLLVGLLPDILYTVTTPLANNPIAVFWSLHQSLNAGGGSNALQPLKQLDGLLLYTLPTVTGLTNVYPVEALPLHGPPGGSTILAVLVGGSWSLGYLALLVAATWRPFSALRASGALRWGSWGSVAARAMTRAEAQSVARLMLALTAWLTIAAYTLSATAANNPHSGRYMIGLLVVTPAVLWPLLDATSGSRSARRGAWRDAWRDAGRPLAIALLGVSLVMGVASVARALPDGLAADARDIRFVNALRAEGVTRFYADYWTCDLINFTSRERLTCAVIGDYGQPGLTRYRPYYDAVRADPSAPYVLSPRSAIERTFLLHAAQTHQRYSLRVIAGHDVYTPIGA
ncbi:MAG TPA: hypothetical protein VE338_10310 [Ktedonobacterales bacterium]|nr:hypothetical protein [Ktedonobacterales bacterium]